MRESLERVNMADFANRSVAELSGGEQQRVALARALAAKPRLLMLDEPLAALDRSLRLELQEELHTLLQQPELPVIYVTHDQEEAVILGDRLAILHDGLIEQTGTAQELYNAPNSRWVAEFLGMNNFIPGEISSLNPFTIHTTAGDFTPPVPGKTLPAIGTRATVMIKTNGVSVIPSPGKINAISGIVRSCVFRENWIPDPHRLRTRAKAGISPAVSLMNPGPLCTWKFLHLRWSILHNKKSPADNAGLVV